MLEQALDTLKELIHNLEDLEEEKDDLECTMDEYAAKEWYHNPAAKFDYETRLEGIKHKISLYKIKIAAVMKDWLKESEDNDK